MYMSSPEEDSLLWYLFVTVIFSVPSMSSFDSDELVLLSPLPSLSSRGRLHCAPVCTNLSTSMGSVCVVLSVLGNGGSGGG